MALIPRERFYKSDCVDYHRNHCFMIKDLKSNTIILEDSIVAGLSRYQNVWNEYLALLNALNLGIGGDRVKNALWPAINLPLLPSVQNILILCGTNNISIDTPRDIAYCIISIIIISIIIISLHQRKSC